MGQVPETQLTPTCISQTIDRQSIQLGEKNNMPEQGEQANVYHPETGGNVGKWILLALAIVFVAGAGFFGYDMHTKVTKLTEDQTASQQQIAGLTTRMQPAEDDSEALGEKIGLTKKEMVARAAELQRMQQASAQKLA